jgi:hypothetical protein
MNAEQWVQLIIAASLIILLFLVIWSRIMGQSIYDTVIEIRDIVKDLAK